MKRIEFISSVQHRFICSDNFTYVTVINRNSQGTDAATDAVFFPSDRPKAHPTAGLPPRRRTARRRSQRPNLRKPSIRRHRIRRNRRKKSLTSPFDDVGELKRAFEAEERFLDDCSQVWETLFDLYGRFAVEKERHLPVDPQVGAIASSLLFDTRVSDLPPVRVVLNHVAKARSWWGVGALQW